jgi:acyl carrier protein
VPLVVRLRGVVDVGLLERAVGEVVVRHEVLRSRFVVVGGEPVQVVEEGVVVPVSVVDVSGAVDVEAVAREVVVGEVGRGFDLSSAPLLRVSLVRLGSRDSVLVVVMHHAVSDGWSRGVFVREVCELYGAWRAGRVAALEELPVQYADFAVWQREWLSGEVLRGQLDYWRERLAGFSGGVGLPADRVRPARPSFEGGVVGVWVPGEVVDRLRVIGRDRGATLFMVLLAAFQGLLARYAGVGDVAVGVPVAGRVRPELEGLIGFFVNTLVVRSDCSGDPTFEELLVRVRGSVLGAFAHQDVPFDRLVAELAPARDLGRNPLVQVMFQLMNAPREPWWLDGVEAESFPAAAGATPFDLECHLVERDGGLSGSLVFSRDLFDEDRVQRLGQHYQRFLTEIAGNPTHTLHELTSQAEVSSEASPDVSSDLAQNGLATAARVAPRNAVERTIADIWCEVLGLRRERASVHDNFFDVGGQSLLAIKVVALVQERLGIRLPLEALFERPSIAELAEFAVPLLAELESPGAVVTMVAEMSDEEVARWLEATD